MKRIKVQDLQKGDVVKVTTENHVYTLEILNREKRTVMLTSNNPQLAGPAVYTLEGSFDDYGEAVRHNPYENKHFLGLIEINRRLLLAPFLLLSVTQTISVNGRVIWTIE